MEYFTDLGQRIENRWRALNRDEERFSEIAAEEVERRPYGSDISGIVDAFLSPREAATRQLAAPGAFAQPALTLYYGRGFVIDVYFWNNSVPPIHNHPFSGCFTILKGFSLHDCYEFEIREKLGPRVILGELIPKDLAILREGDIVCFSPVRRQLIHSLIHVPNPTVSMVVRTIQTHEYFRYFPPSIAIAMAEPDDLISRQLLMIGWLRRAGDSSYAERIRTFLETSDFETTFRLISAVWGEDVNELIEVVRKSHGDRADLIIPSLEVAARLQHNNDSREQFQDDDSRMIASILMCARERDDIFRLLQEWFPDRRPSDILGEWETSATDNEPS